MPTYLQVFFSKDEKKQLARLAVELDTNMTAIVRQAVQEFLIKYKTKQSIETNADDSSASQAAHTHAQPQELPTLLVPTV